MQAHASKKIKVPLTITAGAYAAGDSIGGLIEFDLLGNRPTGGYVERAAILDDDNVKADLRLLLFEEQPSAFADNSPVSLSFSDLEKMAAGVVEFPSSDYETFNADAVCFSAIDTPIRFHTETGKIWGYLIPTGATTYLTTSGLSVVLWVLIEV